MKIYFNSSLAGKDKYIKEFKTIIKTCKDLGHEIYADHVMKRNYREVNKQSREDHENDFQTAREEINKSDAMIVEASISSIGVGHTMTVALQSNKNVLILTQKTPHGLLIGDPNRLLIIKKYNPKNNNLKPIINDFIKIIEKRLLVIRFNLMIGQEQKDYLEKAAKKLNISKSDFVRRLINKEISLEEDKTIINKFK